jgi:hypothetical protein
MVLRDFLVSKVGPEELTPCKARMLVLSFG